MKLKSLLVEDNPFMATLLSDLLMENHPNIEVMDVAKNGKEGIEKINRLQPELVFLDIEMPDMNGFEMLTQIESIKFQTIFITAHSHYAIKAIRFNALDYLLKPITENELSIAIKRFHRKNNSFSNQNQVKQALINIKTDNIESQILTLFTQKGMDRVPLKEILSIEGDRNYSSIHLTNGTRILASKTLGFFEEILSDKEFFRCHRSFLVNRYHIQSIESNSIKLKNNQLIPISRRKKGKMKEWYYSQSFLV